MTADPRALLDLAALGASRGIWKLPKGWQSWDREKRVEWTHTAVTQARETEKGKKFLRLVGHLVPLTPAVTPPRPERFPRITRRNLLYHVYPLLDSPAWRQNVRQVRRRLDLFNGDRIVGVITGPGLASPLEVRDEFGTDDLDIVTFENQFTSDATTFHNLLPLLAGDYCFADPDAPREATFFAHTKGAGQTKHAKGIMFWRNALYHALLDDWEAVDGLLASYAAVGGCKMVSTAPQTFPNGFVGGLWHYQGTYFWFRHDQIFTRRNWWDVPEDRYGAEAWLGLFLPSDEAATLYQPWPVEQVVSPYRADVHPDRIADPPLVAYE